jgi:uncharacterized membrane protein YtjA (UPF0391 family)
MTRGMDAGSQWRTGRVVLLYAIGFLIVALIAGVLGFVTISGAATWIAQLIFAVFVVLFVVSLVIGRRPPG